MVKGKDRVDDWLDRKVERQRSRKVEHHSSRGVENQSSRTVEEWQKGKTQVSYWLPTDLVEAIHLQAFRDKRSKSEIVGGMIRSALGK